MFTHKVTVYITANDDATRENWAMSFARLFAKINGGFTRSDNLGGWVDANDLLIVEKSIKIETLTTADNLAQTELATQSMLVGYIASAEQEAGLYEIREVKGHLIFGSDIDLLDDGNQIN